MPDRPRRLLDAHAIVVAALLLPLVPQALEPGRPDGHAVDGPRLIAPVEGRQARPVDERPPALEVDFTVVRDDGTPVTDLQVSEVNIRIDGRLRTIRAIRRVAAAAAPVGRGDARRVPRPYGTNQDANVGRSFVLLFDEESLMAGRESQVRGAVEGLLADFAPRDRAMVVALPFGGVRQPFTSDPARIRQAVAGAASRGASGGITADTRVQRDAFLPSAAAQGTRGESGSEMACRTRRFLESLQGFLTGHVGRATPLTVVLFTAGLAAPRRDAPISMAPGMCELLVNDFELVGAAAGAARANFYLLQPSDIGFGTSLWRESIAGNSFLGSDNPLEGIEHLAGTTGAVRLALDATGTSSLVRVARESSAYFVAELEPERREIFGRTRGLAVRVRRPDVTVRARPEITFVEPERARATTRPAVGDLLTSSVAALDLPLRVGGFTMREPGGHLRVGIVIEPAEPGVRLASAGAVLLDQDRIAGRWFAPDAAERPLLGAMAATPGRYRLRVAAIDTLGRSGLAEDDVEARLVPVGPLSLGSLILGVSRGGGVLPVLEFGAEPIAVASFDIYGGEAGLALTARLEVAREPDAAPFLTLPLALARADEYRVVATGSVPIGALPSGDYVVRGVIQLEDGAMGRVSRTLRKVGG